MANSDGTLSAAIIALDCIQFLKKRFPILTQVATDFSKDSVKFNQEVISRVVTPVAAADYNTSTGYVATSTSVTDVPVTINKHKHVSVSFTDQELSSTARNLVQEQVEAAAYSLGRQVSNDLWALVTTSNFGANTAINVANAAAVNRSVVLSARQGLVPAGADIKRQGVVDPASFTALAEDVNLFAKLYNDIQPDYDAGAIAGLGFEKITEFAEMPIGSTPYVRGFFFGKEALVLASRVPADPGMFVGDVPVPALIDKVSDPETGITLQHRYMDNPVLGVLQMHL